MQQLNISDDNNTPTAAEVIKIHSAIHVTLGAT